MDQPQPSITMGKDRAIHCAGAWTLRHLAGCERQLETVSWPDGAEIVWDASGITEMDTGGAVLLQRTLLDLQRKGRRVTLRGLTGEFAGLLEMVAAQFQELDVSTVTARRFFLEKIGMFVWDRGSQALAGFAFLGESAVILLRLFASPGSVRWRAILSSLEVDGFNALPITGLLTFLMGVVIAYQGAEQLRTFGANIFVVDLVGISLLREIAPLVTAILVAGRSGSAYAAQIGTMKVTEELDAIRTLGVQPMHLLVVPKLLALIVALPLLTVYADVVGVFGGMLIAWGQLGVSFAEFLSRFQEAVALKHFVIGVGKAPVFAVIIALVGCYQGFQIRGGVDDVGRHTTISVVEAIFLVIVFDAFFSVLLSWMGV
ncbi:MAG: MlaE family lipid ABC transporter permease subunit [Deltaproteobacteria bacterium]|nr:MlaE family lipid ABC transporter permease subunit [Deltaproteobacteria bacterium]